MFEYNALINAIPGAWKIAIATYRRGVPNISDVSIIDNMRNDILMALNRHNRSLRCIIGGYSLENVCGRNFWLRKRGINVSAHYCIANESTKESKLRLLHFKMLHNIYPSNVQLYKMKIKQSEMCEYCGDVDYVEHLFIHCPRLGGFWRTVENEIYNRINKTIKLTDNTILFGILGREMGLSRCQTQVANHIILVAKMAIGKARAASLHNKHRILSILETELSIRAI